MTTTTTWEETNNRHLSEAFAEIEMLLRRSSRERESRAPNANDQQPAPVRPELLEESALHRLCISFGLTRFERDLLLLCAANELNPGILDLCKEPGQERVACPTLGLALRLLRGGHWNALSPARPLRAWRLVEIGAGGRLVDRPLRLDERILHYLKGIRYIDERLCELVRPIRPAFETWASNDGVAEGVAAILNGPNGPAVAPLVQIWAGDPSHATEIAARACSLLGLPLYQVNASDIPAETGYRRDLITLWEREVILAGCALLVEVVDLPQGMRKATSFLGEVRGPVLVSARDPVEVPARPSVCVEVPRPTKQAQRREWLTALGTDDEWSAQVDEVLAHFEFGREGIRAAAFGALTGSASDMHRLWRSCRIQGRRGMGELARRIEPEARWEDLILPADRVELLRTISDQVRRRKTVYDDWGFGRHRDGGLGITALFSGASGTGKTMSAKVIASALELDLYRIDLSGVVSKYVGETEKNMRRVFDSAQDSGAILLFDEADALFGRRTEVMDGHDRYANIEISYLLQRMESYRGLAILTTNMKKSLDRAFLRRIRFVVEFPFPNAQLRRSIWKTIFPIATPLGPLDYEKLARLNITGGTIRNIAVNAAFLAAADNESVQMAHLQQAARWECEKLDRPATEAEVGAWT